MAKKNQYDHYDIILTKLGFDANDFIVDQNNEYNKISSADFTLGFVKYLLGSTKTWEAQIPTIPKEKTEFKFLTGFVTLH